MRSTVLATLLASLAITVNAMRPQIHIIAAEEGVRIWYPKIDMAKFVWDLRLLSGTTLDQIGRNDFRYAAWPDVKPDPKYHFFVAFNDAQGKRATSRCWFEGEMDPNYAQVFFHFTHSNAANRSFIHPCGPLKGITVMCTDVGSSCLNHEPGLALTQAESVPPP